MKRWLGRLSFSFLIIGLILGWHGYTEREKLPQWRATLELAGAAVCIVLFIAGTRERHRGED